MFERVLQQAQAQANARTIPKILTDKFFSIPPMYSATVSTSVYPITLNFPPASSESSTRWWRRG